jgi:hypothetical protein
MANEYGKFDAKFAEERERGDRLERQFDELEEVYEKTRKTAHRQKLEIIDYEQRYMGIDITKLHE